MEAALAYAALGVVSSGCAGYALANHLAGRRERRRLRQMALAPEAGESKLPLWLAWRLTHGVAVLEPLAQSLLRRPLVARYIRWMCQSLEERHVVATASGLLSSVVALGAAVVVAGWLLAGSPMFGIAVAGAAVVAAGGAAKSAAERRESDLRGEVPDALRSLGVCFRAGLTLSQTLRQTAHEMKGPLGALFQSAALVLDTGGTSTEALAVFRQRADVPELAFVAVALDVQHRSGGSVAPVLAAARESVESELELETSLRVQTAQAKLSARIVTLMPFVLVALFSFMSPGFLDPFFASVPGMALLAVALLMQAAGVAAVHRMLRA
ncbi:MAG: type II secretion system protein [Adlercreutzia sp.]|uniref:type II secretion system F family protein n=1 Tax=uncultured Adlercreutzia sp. TaxID=875803 RepID=UPI00216EA747|nr:type II secretion system F family protein [uncultured Adlercreutzia sp.]MCI8424177.1 type II secretion system protein [Adlercreutzia sp.]